MTPGNDEEQPRTIRVLADYECHPLWPGENVGDLSPHDPDLGLTPDLAARLDAWAAEFDAILCRDDPASSAFPTPEAELAFARTGEKLAVRLARELGPGWRVRYFDPRTGADRSVPAP
ncbi:hypothetical protein OOK31_16700 [Streptomyces sp. NBC_00249]|uniref:hypothetical protein n=1 Tax=Streptomyces sp. NBC_00249 TaxID=2975690 RepID=UPI00225A54FA|nr:hypothetical protein [Streptomyces sp. NBC_00249]MCX5195525.1 hypothetical protein [Streptomyces sp. NBC_00249]